MKIVNSDEPIDIDKSTWIYGERDFATLVHEVRDLHGNYLRTVQIEIPKSVFKKLVKP